MSDDAQKPELPPGVRGGKDLSDLVRKPPHKTRMQRVRAWFTKGRIITLGVVTALVAVLGLANSALDLWGRVTSEGDAVDIDFQPAWNNSDTPCVHNNYNRDPVAIDEEVDGEPRVDVSDGDVGLGIDDRPRFSLAPWVHREVIDLSDAIVDMRPNYVRLAASRMVRSGGHAFSIYIANRTDDPLMVTDIQLNMERSPMQAGTVLVEPGGDPSTVTALGFDLDEEKPVARAAVDDCQDLGEPFFESYRLDIEPRGTEAIRIGVAPGDCWCEVRLDVEYWHQDTWHSQTFPTADDEPITVVDVNSPDNIGRVYITHQANERGYIMADCDGRNYEECLQYAQDQE